MPDRVGVTYPYWANYHSHTATTKATSVLFRIRFNLGKPASCRQHNIRVWRRLGRCKLQRQVGVYGRFIVRLVTTPIVRCPRLGWGQQNGFLCCTTGVLLRKAQIWRGFTAQKAEFNLCRATLTLVAPSTLHFTPLQTCSRKYHFNLC